MTREDLLTALRAEQDRALEQELRWAAYADALGRAASAIETSVLEEAPAARLAPPPGPAVDGPPLPGPAFAADPPPPRIDADAARRIREAAEAPEPAWSGFANGTGPRATPAAAPPPDTPPAPVASREGAVAAGAPPSPRHGKAEAAGGSHRAWTPAEDARAKTLWRDPAVDVEAVAVAVDRTVAAVRARAWNQHWGPRPAGTLGSGQDPVGRRPVPDLSQGPFPAKPSRGSQPKHGPVVAKATPGERPSIAEEAAHAAAGTTPLRVCWSCAQRTTADPCAHCGKPWNPPA